MRVRIEKILKSGKYLLCCVLLLVCVSSEAKKKQMLTITPVLTAEEEQRFEYYFYTARWLFEQEDYERAFRMFRFCHRLNPRDAIVNMYLGDFFSAMRSNDVAVDFYEQSYRANPKNEGILYRLEHCYASLGDCKNALHMLNIEEKIRGYDAYIATNRYRIYTFQGKGKEALREVERYLQLDPENIEFLMMRVQLCEALPAKKPVMKKAYEDAIAIDPSNITLLNNYAYFLATHKGDLSLAEQMSREAIMQVPDNPTFLDTYAWILYLRGETQLAKLYIQNAVRYFGKDEQLPKEIVRHYRIIMNKKK